ncbi:MAG: zinc-finger domain-containing protein [Pseudomonadota bacterium]|nr:zinc-finger domain-containing protein [Pseudomonadota bacterium]
MANKDEENIFSTQSLSVFCKGGDNTLGHPGVYLNFGDKTQISCPYCSQRFKLEINEE